MVLNRPGYTLQAGNVVFHIRIYLQSYFINKSALCTGCVHGFLKGGGGRGGVSSFTIGGVAA